MAYPTFQRDSTIGKNHVLPETRALAVIGCADLLATVYFVSTEQASEANPLMAGILENSGPIGFVVFKALMLGIPLIIAELARKQSPHFVQKALKIGVGAYVVLLGYAYLPRFLMMFA